MNLNHLYNPLKNKALWLLALVLWLVVSCREIYDYINYDSETYTLQEPDNQISTKGLYLLNEGNMGSNKASLSFFSYRTGQFTQDFYTQQNPEMVQNLGDVGNDIEIYKGRLYAVINLSNYVEVMDAETGKHIGSVKVPNCRNITFQGNYAYVSSFAGAVELNPNYSQKGFVAKIDLSSLQVVGKAEVGYQPEELEIVGNKLYVANSGGYRAPNYDNTLSVIDLDTFLEIKRIEVETNLAKVRKDKNEMLWVTTRGNYGNIPPKTFIINPKTDSVEKEIGTALSNFAFYGDSVYYYSYIWSAAGSSSEFGILNINNQEVITRNLFSDEIKKQIKIPYGITINPSNGDIFIADAKNYVSPGELFCFNNSGTLKWKATTGDIPAHFAWLED
ncbi:MAG: YncE family protein [Bergeyella zoohelcum]|nr:YncE family protein [Bergeyella zoohelcum]